MHESELRILSNVLFFFLGVGSTAFGYWVGYYCGRRDAP